MQKAYASIRIEDHTPVRTKVKDCAPRMRLRLRERHC
jgi:hypothetical protein